MAASISGPSLDTVVYTASLATKPQEIDRYLDAIRALTARPNFNPQQPTPEEQKIITDVQQQIEQYLVEREPIRLFTRDSLHTQIEQHLIPVNRWQGLHQIITIWGLSVLGGVSAYLLPFVRNPHESLALATSTAMVCINLGAAWLFLSALRAFKSQLRAAFIFICTGVVVLALGLLYVTIVRYWGPGTVSTNVFIPIPFMCMALLLTEGIRRYALLVGVNSWLLSRKTTLILGFVAPVVVSLAVTILLATILKSLPISVPQLLLSIATIALITQFACTATTILPRVIARLTSLYRPPIRGLLLAIYATFVMSIYGGIFQSVDSLLLDISNPIIALLVGVLYARAGYQFNRITRH